MSHPAICRPPTHVWSHQAHKFRRSHHWLCALTAHCPYVVQLSFARHQRFTHSHSWPWSKPPYSLVHHQFHLKQWTSLSGDLASAWSLSCAT
ncbi:hypothetical protein M404DRAFT_414518 [Pisolithus tinctorius Marx 270]|uniref:Uncharacterized protein n=1 Tax=Pisolithus tinctorius Marx 270 TaxID=870435 RepID=A0A0C3MYP9_PISTI|nr:hypothetical protein M404DRAFT_414518 [Pisolithus tinctorius Marx 270]